MSVAAAALRQQSDHLPQPSAGLRLLPAPETEPPFDDAAPALRLMPPETGGTLPLPFPEPEARPKRAHLRVVPDAPVAPVEKANSGVTRLRGPALPGLRVAAEGAALLIAQILTGERLPGQIRSAAVPDVFQLLCRKAAFAPSGPRLRATLRGVHICCPAPGAAEVVTVIHGLTRPKAMAFRLEARRNRWVCTALELG